MGRGCNLGCLGGVWEIFEPPNQSEAGEGEWKLAVSKELGLVWHGAAHCDEPKGHLQHRHLQGHEVVSAFW